MPVISNPAETDRVWTYALETEVQRMLAYINSATGRQLSPEDIQQLYNYLLRHDQVVVQYIATAEALAGSGYPRLLQRVCQLRHDTASALRIYSEMYASAVQHRAQTARIMQDASVEVTRNMAESNAHTRSVYNRINEMSNLVNEGVPYGLAIAISRCRH
jgi:hypothetical protein